jgi:DNA polymerase III subunit epsilon
VCPGIEAVKHHEEHMKGPMPADARCDGRSRTRIRFSYDAATVQPSDPVRDFAVIDFETTGLSTHDRVIEVGVVVVRDYAVADTFSALMDPGFPIPAFITELTGISPAMVRGKPAPEAVMPTLRRVIGDLPCVAHNAAFDRRFLVAEMARAALPCHAKFFCSMLLSRRLIQEASTHRLGALLNHLGIAPPAGSRAHRALDDCLMTVRLWQHLMGRISTRLPAFEPDPQFITRLSKVPKAHVDSFFFRHAREACAA